MPAFEMAKLGFITDGCGDSMDLAIRPLNRASKNFNGSLERLLERLTVL